MYNFYQNTLLPIALAAVMTIAGTGTHGADDGFYAQFNLPRAVAHADGGLFVVDTFNNLIRLIDQDGYTTTVAGHITPLDDFRFPGGHHFDAHAAGAMFNRPSAVITNAFAPGALLVVDSGNHALRLVLRNHIFTLAGGQAGYVDGYLYQALFNNPTAAAADIHGNIFIADSGNHAIRKIDPAGYVTTVAAGFNGPMGLVVAADGRIFVADTGNNVICIIENDSVVTVIGVMQITLDNYADLDYNEAVEEDYIIGGFADGYNPQFNIPMGLALWNDILFVADSGNNRIRGVLPDGYTFTLAGNYYVGNDDGPLHNATFHLPQGIYVAGDIMYVADTGNNLIRTINLTYLNIPNGNGGFYNE